MLFIWSVLSHTHLTREVTTVSYRNCFAALQRVLFLVGQFFPFGFFAHPFPSAMDGILFFNFESPPFRSLLMNEPPLLQFLLLCCCLCCLGFFLLNSIVFSYAYGRRRCGLVLCFRVSFFTCTVRYYFLEVVKWCQFRSRESLAN